MKNIINFIKKHEKIFFLFLLIAFCIIFYSIYLFTTFPDSQGWGQFYSGLFTAGKIPYRDFYYYLPPYNLLLDTIIWKLSFNHFIIYQLIRLFERIVMVGLIYHLLCKKFKPRNAFVGTAVGSTILSATVFDIVGDYNQTTLLLTIVLSILYYNYFESIDNRNLKKQYVLLFLSGIIIGLSFLLKQTLFVSECLFLFPFLTFVLISRKNKNYFKSLLVSLLGILLPIIISFIILHCNGALLPFLDQVYLGESGKGSLFDILLSLYTSCMNLKFIIFGITVSSYIIIKNRLYNRNIFKENNKYICLILGIVSILAFALCFNNRINSLEVFLKHKIGIIFIFTNLFLVIIDCFTSKKYENNSILLSVLFFLINLLLTALLLFKTSISEYIYYGTSLFDFINDICVVTTIVGIILMIYYLYNYFHSKNVNWLLYGIMVLGGIIYLYNQSMSATDRIPNAGLVILISYVITLLLDKFNNIKGLIKYSAYLISVFIIVIVMSQKIANAYSWWGWTETAIDNKKYTINIPGLEGYLTTKDKKNMYEELYKVLKENSNSESVIYGFPFIKVYNVLLNNYNINTFVPVPWYDVCSDKYASLEAKKLRKDPPDIIIWHDIPNAIETHESIFRNGEQIAQRKIIKWFAKELKNKNYVLIGQYNDIFIYKHKDGNEIKYKYIKDQKAVNSTLNY